MTAGGDQDPARTTFSATRLDLVIRLAFIALLGYLSFHTIAPFLRIGVWSAILAVALYPLFDWLARRVRPRVAAVLVTLLSLMIIIGPVTWLGFGMIVGVGSLVAGLDTGQMAVPLPSEAVREWPIVGERLHQLWSLAATNIKVALTEMAPMLKPLGGKLLDIAQGALLGMFELIVSIVVAWFLFTRGPQFVEALGSFLGRVLSLRGKELVHLAGATIRNVSDVVGIALLHIPSGCRLLGRGHSRSRGARLSHPLAGYRPDRTRNLVHTDHRLELDGDGHDEGPDLHRLHDPVGLLDNVLRPVLMARGLSTPMPVIVVGVIGGTMSYGIIGLFFGPIVLSVAWAVIAAWAQTGGSEGK